MKNLKKIQAISDSLNSENEIADIPLFNFQSLCYAVGSASKHMQKRKRGGN